MIKNILIFIFILTTHLYFSQSDSDTDQQTVYTYLYSKETDRAKDLIEKKFLVSEDNSKKIIGYVYLSDYYSLKEHENENEKVKALENATSLASKTKDPQDMGYVYLGYSLYYQNLNKNDLFIKSVNNAIDIFSKYPGNNFMLSRLYFLRYNYKSKNPLEKNLRSDCIKANEYAKKSKNPLLINFTYSNLGYFYKNKFNETQDKKYLDSANISYSYSHKYSEAIQNPKARKRSILVYYLNYGSLLNSMTPNSYEKCLELYNKILVLSEKDKDFKDITALTYNNMGSAYENLGKTDQAEKYYNKAYWLTKDNKDIFTIHKIIILNNLSRIYENLNRLDEALKYEREAKDLIKDDNENRFANNTKALEIFYQTEQKNRQIKQLEEKNKIYSRQKILYLIMALLACSGIIFLIFLFRFKQKISIQKTNLLEAEKNETELILQLEKEEKARLKAEQELLTIQQGQLQKKALATSLRLDYKNTFIKKLKEKIKEKKDINLEKILKEDRLNDTHFHETEDIIEKVHPNFFKRLKELSKSKLSNLDLKYAAYIYLNMDNLQIANSLKVDSKTVRVTKYRLKQKIGLSKEDDLHGFIQNLEG